jgi:hypothetical protein
MQEQIEGVNMKSKWSGIYLVVFVIASLAAARAQVYRVESGAGQHNYKIAAEGQNTFYFEANIESPMVTGSPYTAKAVTTMTQTLADGNKIKHTSEVELARDSEGRTRREQSLGQIGPWDTNAKGSIVVISDPVAHVRYEMGPDGGRQIARKMDMYERTRIPEARAKAMAEADMAKHEGRGVGVGVGVGVGTEPGVGSSVVIVTNGGETIARRKAEEDGVKSARIEPKVEDLGQQTIEGVSATGTRKTITIPAGQIGNEQPINIVTETWFSPELKMTIVSKRNDPRVGETEFRLTNIQRSEPAASLFQVPAGFEVRDLTNQREREF